MISPQRMGFTLVLGTLAVAIGADAVAQDAPPGPAATDGRAVIDAALGYLKSQQQPDGSWQRSPREPVTITALVVRAFAADEKTGPKRNSS